MTDIKIGVNERPPPEGDAPTERPGKETTIKLESLTVMNLKPDDILIFKIANVHEMDEDEIKANEEYLREKGIENEVIFTGPSTEIAAIRKEK
jgi:hypothetical protein